MRLLQKSTVSQSCLQDCLDFAERMKRKALRVRSEGSIPPYVTEAESRKQHSDSPLCNSRLLIGVDRCKSNGSEAQLTRSKVSTAHPYYGLLLRALGRLVMSLRYLGSVRNVCVDRYFQYFCWEERSCKWISDIKFALLHISYPRLSLSDERNKKIYPSPITAD